MINIAELEERFPNRSNVRFTNLAAGMIAIEVDNSRATALISLHGGQVVTWRPKHESVPVLWASTQQTYSTTRALRAGVPICWPWFGTNPTDSTMPAHGFARISPWNITQIGSREDGATAVVLTMQPHSTDLRFHLPNVALTIEIVVGDRLEIALVTENSGTDDFLFTEGLHTYFTVGDVGEIRVIGLDADEFKNLLDGTRGHQETEPVQFRGELGRIYVNSHASCTIEDPQLQRSIRVEKTGSLSTAVWNPGATTSAGMSDFAPDGWRSMVCVESANALENVVRVRSGESHTLGVTYSTQPLARL